jgi:hypothetical protein
LRGRWFAESDEREVIWAECIEGASSRYKPDKGGLVDWVVALTCGRRKHVLETKLGLE